MKTGDLHATVTFERRVESTPTGPDPSFEWVPFKENVRVSITYKAGREQRRGDQIEGVGTHEIVSRWFAGVAPDMRIVDGSRVYQIVSCGDMGGRRQWLTCSVSEVN